MFSHIAFRIPDLQIHREVFNSFTFSLAIQAASIFICSSRLMLFFTAFSFRLSTHSGVPLMAISINMVRSLSLVYFPGFFL
jgi:hypothetical protein